MAPKVIAKPQRAIAIREKPQIAKREVFKMEKPAIMGGPGSLPPPRKPVLKKVEAKKLIAKPAPMTGGPGSLPPKPVAKKMEAPKLIAKPAPKAVAT